MKILVLANNWVGWQIVGWLKERSDQIVGLVVHPLQKGKYRSEIIQSANLPENFIFDGSKIHEPEVFNAIQELKADIGLSISFGYILRNNFLDLFPAGVINLHSSYLPFNRGAHPNIWSIIDKTPAGATLHYIDEGVDTGRIIAQKQVAVMPEDTGETLYRKLEQASISLFMDAWPLVCSGKICAVNQSVESGTHHMVRDLAQVDEIQLDQMYRAADLINILRARTFPPYPGAFYVENNRKVYLRLQLIREEDL
jgi:methionyl-tRNA formyltransferase